MSSESIVLLALPVYVQPELTPSSFSISAIIMFRSLRLLRGLAGSPRSLLEQGRLLKFESTPWAERLSTNARATPLLCGYCTPFPDPGIRAMQ
jgi:hypothetical protein